MVTPQRSKTKYWTKKGFEEVNKNITEESLGELFDHLNEINKEKAHNLARAFHSNSPESYDNIWDDVREIAKEKITKEQQPEWAWSFFSQTPEEIEKELLEIPSGGENKGLLVDRNLETAFLYAKKADGISGIQHVERWVLNIDNAESVGYKFASENYDRVALTFGDQVVEGVAADFNQNMVMSDRLRDFFKENFGDEGTAYYTKFADTWVKELEDLENLGDEGHFVSAGITDFRYATGNIAFEFPEDDLDEYSPKELYEASKMVIVDAGEYDTEINQNLEEDPFKVEENWDNKEVEIENPGYTEAPDSNSII